MAEAIPRSAQNQFDSLYEQAKGAAAARNFDLAVQLYDAAIALNPHYAEAYYKRGNSQKDLGRLEAAVASYNQAIERNAEYAFAYCNRGVVQQALGLPAAALSSYDRALSLDPADALAHYNRALLLQESGRWDEAQESYNRAIACDPEFADAQFNRSLALLYRGDFAQGWRSYEWRWKNAQRLAIGDVRDFTQPLWLGEEPIVGKRLLLHCEGGLGDTLQFCRYVPLIAAMGAIVYLEVQAPLLRLLASLNGVSGLVAKGSQLPMFDYHCPLMSLPLACKTTLDSGPSAHSYLHSDKAIVARWLLQLPPRRRTRVGLTWSGNPNNPIDRSRCVRLADWATQLPANFDYFCLQTDVRDADKGALDSNPGIRSFVDCERDFADTAALCDHMDVVISVDTSVAHLSAALGRPTWILLPLTPDWRWLRDRDDSPWYPTAKLYRQKIAGAWDEVFARIAEDLRREFPISPPL